MTIATGAAEVLLVANKPGLTEKGGGHGAKGVDFQRWWAVLRMLELEQSNAPDFLLLFEAVQDVTELDSLSAPTKAAIYQVKKKDTGTWSWSVLTGTSAPKQPKPAKKSAASGPAAPVPTVVPSFDNVGNSVLGKIHLSLMAFEKLPAEGIFISNAGCDVPLASGANAATSLPCSLSDLAADHAQLLTDALNSLSAAGAPIPDLKRVRLARVAIHPDDPSAPAVAKALELLTQRSPGHAAQARAFVESLVMKVSALGRRTATCATFADLVKERGFSRAEFHTALSSLATIPDRNALFESWLAKLQQEGFDFRALTTMRMAAARVAAERLTGPSPEAHAIDSFCDSWAQANACGPNLKPYVDAALVAMRANFGQYRDEELLARFVMRVMTT
ncbi:hypothetical protein FHR56_001735 [Xanthomonas sacchari]|uniref:dsDNA nuclease domain-containing protein n=1 Tax=unclassified Xanthomonas TaxID=2643310 RepID=UPI0013692C40|nr:MULTISPECIES: dsDNA nuclease domain-containing protein [unclassified Xanthomonas]MBB6366622.1 hypothetical protein [Xanthomonas sp. F10]